MDFNVELFLVVITAITGLIYVIYHMNRWRKLSKIKTDTTSNSTDNHIAQIIDKPSFWVELAVSIFPIIFIVLLLRSFLVEPFRIPSGSMRPSLQIGDFILVNKYIYGIRLPVWHYKIIDFQQPQRGDAVVFRFPQNPQINYIKRLIGLPGDVIEYKNKALYINNQLITHDQAHETLDLNGDELTQFNEHLGPINHSIYHNPALPSVSGRWIVPPHHYFVMGDNRDNSNDSRFWGFVPESNLVGRAFFVWMHWDSNLPGFPINWSRIGTVIR